MSDFKDMELFDATAVFLNTDEHAETATHYPAGDETAGVSIAVIADRKEETDSGTGYGDGANVEDRQYGRAITRAIRLEMLKSIPVTEEGKDDLPSTFLLEDGTYCRAVRQIGEGGGLKTILCVSVDRTALGRER